MLRVRQRFGKYVIQEKLAEGGFAAVFRARDTIEGIRVALKIPHEHLMNDQLLKGFRQEARLAAKLDHPNILRLKYADFIEDRFVMVTPLSESSLEHRLQRRLAPRSALDYAMQLLQAVAYAHDNKVVHCDIKPDNLLIFPNNHLMLTDFGIARVAHRTLRCSGSGTLGYVAPEQAMGKPSYRSDVFSLGIVIYRMFTGVLPEWPYTWPMQGYPKLKERASEPLIALLQKATAREAENRFPTATHMLAAMRRIKRPVVMTTSKSTKVAKRGTGSASGHRWQVLRRREFQKQYAAILETRYNCGKCDGPVSEAMLSCPWCGVDRTMFPDVTRLSLCCPRCNRGVKKDWPYCAWCYGPGFEVETTREYSDRRYTARCSNRRCSRKELMPFMRYCPWCHVRVKRKWKLEGSPHACSKCGCGVASQYWSYCPWCTSWMGDS